MAKTITRTNRPRLTLDIAPALRRRIKVAAAARDLSVSTYVTRLLERAVPAGRPLNRAADGTISAVTLRRFAALRAEQPAPFPEDTADLVRESRTERDTRL
jgi:hypothetical protein